jgi:hypothetical protein
MADLILHWLNAEIILGKVKNRRNNLILRKLKILKLISALDIALGN